MNQVLLSVCISTYNRRDRCLELVKRIFSLKDDRINVYVIDDNSTDDTVEQLCALGLKDLYIKHNSKNIGACKNWYKTINSGTGKYILHVLDRDLIDAKVLKQLLNVLEKYNISGGYIGKSTVKTDDVLKKEANIYIFPKGRQAFNAVAGVPIHPTGFLVKREVWDKSRVKKYFYQTEKYGIYPHSYVMAFISLDGDLLQLQTNFFSYKYQRSNRKSRFYDKQNNENYWWMPKMVIETENKMILELYKYAGVSYREEFVINRFRDGLYRATIGYKNTVKNENEMRHYNLETKEITNVELFGISLCFFLSFLHIVDAINVNEKSRLKREVIKELINHIKNINK